MVKYLNCCKGARTFWDSSIEYGEQVMQQTENITSSSIEEESPVERISLFSETECEAIRNKVHELRHLWISRHAVAPFYTLGAASYIDGYLLPKYLDLARKFNNTLREEFAWMYRKLFEALEIQLQGPILYAERFAVPGFHVLLSHRAFEMNFASFHFDLQYDFLYRNYQGADLSRPFSFTLAIALPISGAGMTMCDLQRSEVKDLPMAEVRQISMKRKHSIVSYKVGTMVVHSGHHFHKLSPMSNLQPTDERITLQGHAICCDGNWQIYW